MADPEIGQGGFTADRARKRAAQNYLTTPLLATPPILIKLHPVNKNSSIVYTVHNNYVKTLTAVTTLSLRNCNLSQVQVSTKGSFIFLEYMWLKVSASASRIARSCNRVRVGAPPTHLARTLNIQWLWVEPMTRLINDSSCLVYVAWVRAVFSFFSALPATFPCDG